MRHIIIHAFLYIIYQLSIIPFGALHTLQTNTTGVPAIKQQLLSNVTKKKAVAVNPLQTLSTRETEVMHQLIKGATLAAIGRSLNLQIVHYRDKRTTTNVKAIPLL